MSKADKLFYDIDYTGIERYSNGVDYISEEGLYENRIGFIEYENYGKVITIDKDEDFITLKELQAINEKCKELRWLDE